VKMAQGYVTDDGTFFESKLEAELFEAEMRLRGQLVGMDAKLNPEQILAIIIEVMPDVRRYIDAYQAQDTAARNQQAKEQERAEYGAAHGKNAHRRAAIGALVRSRHSRYTTRSC